MDRNILTIGEQFDASDFCQTNKNSYIAIAKLAAAILGTDTLLNGFTCTQNVVPNLNVLVGPGEIYQTAAVDTTPYGDLPVDSHIILKQGVNLDPLPTNPFTFTAPVTPGDSVNYLIEFALEEDDINPENREFYEAAPQVVDTIRQDSVFVKALAGTPAPTGTQTTPAPEAGFVGGFVVTIDYGQTTIVNSDIAVYASAPFITETLTEKISEATANTLYAPLPIVTFRAWQSVSQSIGGGATLVNFETVDFDTTNAYNNTTMKFQPTTAGYYRITGSLGGLGSGAAHLETEIWKNGAVYATDVDIGTAVVLAGNVNDIVYLNGSTDYAQIYAANVGAGTFTSTNATNRTYFNAELIK
jgi:hypothetical protein